MSTRSVTFSVFVAVSARRALAFSDCWGENLFPGNV